MKSLFGVLKILSVFVLLFLACSVFSQDPTDIVLQYKYKVNYTDQDGKKTAEAYILVEYNTDTGVYGSVYQLSYNKKAKTYSSPVATSIAFNYDATRTLVTASDTSLMYFGPQKLVLLKGKYGGFTPFSILLSYVAPTLTGSEANYSSADSWYATKKASMKLDKVRTKHYIEENDFTMVDVLEHLERWLADKGYTEI